MDLYLITGFLGAGKTTVLKNLIEQMAGKRLAVVVNEFGKQGMDAELLRPLGAALRQIAGGSVFCACRADQFAAALVEVADAAPEVIFVEASGLSDPGGIEKLLALPGLEEVNYRGALCVVDADGFEKVLATATVCRKQLAVARLVLLNKTDLVDEERQRALMEKLESLAPGAMVYPTRQGRIAPEWLETTAPAGERGEIHTRDIGLQRRLVRFGKVNRYQLEKFIGMLAPDTHRVKGFVRCEEGLFYVDCVGARVRLDPWAGMPPDREGLVVLAGPGLAMGKALERAAKWYAGQIERVE